MPRQNDPEVPLVEDIMFRALLGIGDLIAALAFLPVLLVVLISLVPLPWYAGHRPSAPRSVPSGM